MKRMFNGTSGHRTVRSVLHSAVTLGAASALLAAGLMFVSATQAGVIAGLDGGQGQARSLALLRDDYVHPRWRSGQCERTASGGAVLPPAGIRKEHQQAVPRPDRVSDLRQGKSEGL